MGGLEDISCSGMASRPSNAVLGTLGDPQVPRIVANLPLDALWASTCSARVPLPEPSGGRPENEERERHLSATEVTQVGLIFRSARQKVGLPDIVPFEVECLKSLECLQGRFGLQGVWHDTHGWAVPAGQWEV